MIFYMGGDAVGLGLVASLNRPGRNFSGATVLNTELVPKRLEMLHELVPAASSFAVLLNPSNRNAEGQWRDLQEAARGRRLQLHRLHASNDHEIDAALASLPRLNTGGLVIGADGMFVAQGERIAALTVRHVVPAIFQLPEFAAAGGLVSYAGSMTDAYRQVGAYAGRVLKGERPAAPPRTPRNSRRLILAPRHRRRHRIGSNGYVDRGRNRLRYCNMKCRSMSQMGH